MAETLLNANASIFRPRWDEPKDLDLEFYLPEHLLISPNRSSIGNFDPSPLDDFYAYGLDKSLSYERTSRAFDDYYYPSWESAYYTPWEDSCRPYSARRHPNKRPSYPSQKYSRTPNSTVSNRPKPVTSTPVARLSRPVTKSRNRIPTPVKSMQSKAQSSVVGYDAECLTHLVRSQMETYFSDKNLYEEVHSNIQYYMKLDEKRWVPVHVVCALPAIRKLTSEREVVLKALRTSNLLELNAQETLVRRPNYIPPADYKVRKNLRRSVLVYGIPKRMTDGDLRNLLNMHGNILCVAFESMDEGPDSEIGCIIMKKKLSEARELSEVKTAFVVFESQSQANKCVKSRSRGSLDGIRTMHKYDYNKVIKRLGKGVSPLFTPTHSPLNTMSPMSTPGSYSGMSPAFQLSPMATHRSPVSKSNRINSTARPTPFRKSPWNVPKPVSKAEASLDWRADKAGVTMQARSSSALNRRILVAKDIPQKVLWPKKQFTKTAFDILNGTKI